MTSVLVLAAMASLTPEQAAHVAADLVGRPDIADALVRVCQRESRCSRIGVHEVDAHLSRSSYVGQIQLGHLDARCQEQGPAWATVGAFGLNTAAHWQYMPRCYDPRAFEVPIVSAMVAARKYLARCDGKRTRRWCPRRAA